MVARGRPRSRGLCRQAAVHPSTAMAWLVGCRHLCGLARRTPAPQLHKPSMQAPWIGPPHGGEDEEEPALLQPTPHAPFKVVTSSALRSHATGGAPTISHLPSPSGERKRGGETCTAGTLKRANATCLAGPALSMRSIMVLNSGLRDLVVGL